jgi:SSS family solute:Na+ symporter
MDYMQLIGILFISPFFVAFLAGMLWKRVSATAGFASMLGGLSGALLEYVLYQAHVISFRSPMAANVAMAVWGFVAGILVLVPVTFLTTAPPLAKLRGLIYEKSSVPEPSRDRWYTSPLTYGCVVTLLFVVLNVIFF